MMSGCSNQLDVLADETACPAPKSSAQDTDANVAAGPHGQKSQLTEEPDAETGCGGCGLHPSLFGRLGNRHVFIVFFCLKNVFQAMVFTYFTGVQTSVERHFHFSSQQMGLLPSIGEIGPLLTAVGMSYIAGRGNRPRWMGLGMLVVCLGTLLGALCYVLFEFPEVRDNKADSRRLCDPLTSQDLQQSADYDVIGNATGPVEAANCTIDVTSSATAYLLWSIVYILIASGSQTIYVVSAPYMDDAVSTKNSPVFFAVAGTARVLGPILGYVLASACISQYVDPGIDPGITRKDQRWIGAWWIGLLVITGLLSVYGWLISLFPRRLSTAHLPIEEQKARLQVSQDSGLSKHGFVSQLLRVIRNPILVSSVLSTAAYITGMLGFYAYQPKYLEHQFRVHKASATTYSAISKVALVFGILGSGLAMRRFRLSGRQVAGAVVLFRLLGALCFLANVWVRCADADLPGTLTQHGLDIGEACAASCGCTTEEYIPVCLRTADGTGTGYQSYFSPCHAGCTTVANDTRGAATYTDCRCLGEPRAVLTTGLCVRSCDTAFKWFLVLTALKGLFASCASIPHFIILLRCVRPEDKAMALGMSSTVTAFAFGAGPLIMGSLVDVCCLVWEVSCGHTGACWVYHPDLLRYALVGFVVACTLVAVGFDCVVFANSGHLQLFSSKEDDGEPAGRADAVVEIRSRSEDVEFTAL